MKGVVSARTFVGWYNGLPSHAKVESNINPILYHIHILAQKNVLLLYECLLLSVFVVCS